MSIIQLVSKAKPKVLTAQSAAGLCHLFFSVECVLTVKQIEYELNQNWLYYKTNVDESNTHTYIHTYSHARSFKEFVYSAKGT